ncbi:MAG: biopolymer transporter ExbD [Bdellovibrionales bacterium]|nr:biopolymer transporter ExbD [Bdellovibrionales bacterium]
MDLEGIEPQRRRTLTLQLASMIDIFFLIIIFLLKATIIADVTIIFPSQMHPPISYSKENLETFPQVVLNEKEVNIEFLNETKQLSEIEKMTEEEYAIMKAKVEAYIKEKDEKVRSQSINVNFITSRENNYKNIFLVVKFLRKIGFQSVQFIAEGGS